MQAYEIDVGHSFIWNKESYVVIRHEEDKMIVHRTVNAEGQVVADNYRFDENFNPYAYVTSVLPKIET